MMNRIIGFISAVALTILLFGGYFAYRQRALQQQRARATNQEQITSTKVVQPLELQVFEDEPFLKQSQAVIGGTVRNISTHDLPDVSIVIALKSRKSNEMEERSIKLQPPDLAVGATGRYQVSVPSGVWSGARILRIECTDRNDLGFTTAPGKSRPRESPSSRTIIVERPRSKGGNDVFINTPDNPEVLR